jgi:hypothetical protein
MVKFIFDKPIDSKAANWTTDRLIQEVYICLAKVKERVPERNGAFYITSKYEKQAREKIYKIAIYRPPPRFIINISDLSLRVKTELEVICKESNKRTVLILLKEVAGRFFENLDFVYYHTSIKSLLQVRLEK